MINIFTYATSLFLILGVYFIVKNKSNNKTAKREILLYSVIPSIIFGSIGHLALGKQVRSSMGWKDTDGVVTLQRELGLFTVALLIMAVLKLDINVGLVWGIFLVFAGINHIIVQKKADTVAIADIVYGGFLIGVFH
jgi:hypothetical protein